MASDHLHRGEAPFGPEVWQRIDEAVVGAATSQLSARRIVEIDGPYGLGLKGLPGSDAPSAAGAGASLGASPTTPLVTVQARFSIPVRDIASFEQTGVPFPVTAAAEAALHCARQEDDLLFNGSVQLGLPGLVTAPETGRVGVTDWDQPGQAFENVLQAVNSLDDAGLHGPYALALEPKRFNVLHRRYPDAAMTEMEHVQQLVTGGVVKAPAVRQGGVLVAVGKQYVAIVVGQDLATGFVGPAGAEYEFFVMESLALRVLNPSALCAIG